jgi:hypothetical protein
MLKECSLVCAPWHLVLRPYLFSQVLWKNTAITTEDMQILQSISHLARSLCVTVQSEQAIDQHSLVSILIRFQHFTELELGAIYFSKFTSFCKCLQLAEGSLKTIVLVGFDMGNVNEGFLDDDKDSEFGAALCQELALYSLTFVSSNTRWTWYSDFLMWIALDPTLSTLRQLQMTGTWAENLPLPDIFSFVREPKCKLDELELGFAEQRDYWYWREECMHISSFF